MATAPRPGRWRGQLRIQLNRVVVIGGLVTLLPMVAIAERARAGAGRRLARRSLRALGRLCGVTFEVAGADRLSRAASYIFVPNHSSLLDVPAMLLARSDLCFMAGADLFRIPLLAGAMRALGTVAIDRHEPAVARRQLAELGRRPGPLCLAVFAEGRIAPPGCRLPFKTGAFVLAAEAGVPVVPVAIHNTWRLLPPGGRPAISPGVVVVEFLEPVSVVGPTSRDRHVLRDLVHQSVTASLDAGPPMAAR
jgi:1-acyl-sn-glycerol-3-phosphate acyltransferase